MYRILVIGQSSFIGINLKKYSKNKNIEPISVRNRNLEEINFKDYDIILHLAAIVHQSGKIDDQEYFTINRDLCLKVAKLSKLAGIKQFIFLSSVKVYGDKGASNHIMSEKSPCFPTDGYGKSKYEAELSLKKLEDDYFKVAILRTPLVYGEGVKANMLKMIKLVERFSILPFGKIRNRRSMTYVENLVGYLDKIIEEQASGVFIAQDEKPVSTTELVSNVAKGLSRNIKLISVPKFILYIIRKLFPSTTSRLFDSLEFDNTFTKEKLNFNPSYTAEEGISKMVKYYKKNKLS